MKWPWKCRADELPAPRPAGGAEARERAQDSLDEARARWPEVYEVAGSLRRLRRDNGFREQIEFMFQGGHHT